MLTMTVVNTILYLILLVDFSHSQECGIQNVVCRGHEKYRSITGTCNNLKHPNWGTINSTYDRLLPPKYGPDGSLPLSVSGNPLPNARILTQKIFTDETRTDHYIALSTLLYGQFLGHDLSFNFLSKSAAACCTPTLQLLENPPKECASIEVPPTDDFFPLVNITCISLLRTTTNQDLKCSKHLRYREQISKTNNYLDLSIIYGCTEAVHQTLRTYVNGTLVVDYREGQQYLPQSVTRKECPGVNPKERCYRTGDPRVDQTPCLAALHIIYAREHNRVAGELQKLNPHWDDETLFEEARRITIAEHEYISYYELLPLYLGTENMLKNGLIYDTDGFVNDYNDTIRPHVFNEHAQGAYRHFHGMIPGNLDIFDEERCPYRSINLRDVLNQPHFLEDRDNFDGILRGMNSQPSIASDMFIVPEMTRYAFLFFTKFGFDIKSVDIQRTRDHGLASYNDMRMFCGLKKAEHFRDFLDVIDKDRVKLLEIYYEHPDDVDLLVGGNLERRVEGTLSGPTFLCIMLQQFYRTRKSDRYWFEHEKCGLTYAQLNEIRKTSISKLFCDNGNHIRSMQQYGFLQISPENPRLPCEVIPGPDLTYWKEKYHN